jgi:hypothetical protein
MYGKHYESMYTGSMCGAGALAFAVWGYVISHQKPTRGKTEFFVELNPGIISFLIGEPEKEVAQTIESFCKPDPKSRTEAEEGKKLVEINPYLYRVVNGAAYDRMQREEDRREYNRERQRVIRASRKGTALPSDEELPPGFPKTEEEAIAMAMTAGIEEGFTKTTWNLAMGRRGRDSKGQKISSWPHYLKAQQSFSDQSPRSKKPRRDAAWNKELK